MKKRGGAKVPVPSGTVTFLFSDIEGSTQRWGRDRAAMQEALRVHDRLMREAIAAHGGHVFKTMGDAFCAAFATPESAAAAALDAQRAMRATDFSAVDGLRVRVAINTGTADERDGDYFGPALNRVARLLTLGHGGQVLLSRMAAGLVRENPPLQATLADLGEYALKDLEGHERVYQLVAPDLQRDFPTLRAALERAWLVPDAMRTRYFTGRDDLLARLRQQLIERHRAALSGLGGVGKTQTAIAYAVRHRAEYPDGVLWVTAETMSGLTSGFVEIAATLRLPAADSNDHDQVVTSVLAWLNRTDRWLLILDNVDDRREVQPFVPARGRGDLLITSRESVFPELGIPRALELRDLDGNEAVAFLLARTGRDDADSTDRAAAAELAGELGNLPLALEQAAAYIAETNVAFAAYLSAFRKRRVTLLEKASGLTAHDTVAVTWAANFEAVEQVSPAAADVLRIGALLAPDAIPFELFFDGAQALGGSIAEALADPDDLAMAEVLRPLARYSLIRSDATLRTFSVHRLVQEIVWTAVAEAERRTYIERAVCALDAAFPEVEFSTWLQCDRLVPHVIAVARWVALCAVHSDAVGRILNQTGFYLRERGRYKEAEPLCEQAVAIREGMLGPEHIDVATSLNGLANVYSDQGRYVEAQARYERALAIREGALGPDHPEVALSLNGLANVYWYQGRHADAKPLLEGALAIRERALGPDHLDVAVTLNGLANVYWYQGRYAEAQSLYERALAIRERTLGPDHPDVAVSVNNLAGVYWYQGRYAEAQSLYERALAIRERALGPEHPDVALGLNNLASVYSNQGRHADAKPLLERALAIRERTLGPDHPHVAMILKNLADVYCYQGRYAEAQPLQERALMISERALGPNHPDVAFSLDGLASVHAKQGRFAEAESLYERALATRERSLGPDHADAVDSLVGLAALRKDQGRNAEAALLLEQALAIKQRTFAANHPELAEIRSSLDALREAITGGAASHVDTTVET